MTAMSFATVLTKKVMIERDGTRVSLWQDTSAPYRTRNKLDKNGSYDVIIVGGGITGVSTALLLQTAGKKVALLEANTLCFGTTGGTTAHLNTLLDTPYTTIIKNFGRENAELVAQSVKEAIDLIRRNIQDFQIDCGFKEASAWLFSQSKEQTEELEEIGRASLEANLDIDYADSIPLAIPFKKALEIKGQAKFHPVRYVYALAAAFEEAGGVIAEHCRVTAAENNEPIEVETELGKLRTPILIYATHIPPGVSLLNTRCAPYRTYAMAFTLTGRSYPEGLIYDMYDPYHYYRTQEIDGQPYLIAGGEDHKTAHESNSAACFRRLESHIRNHFEVDKIHYQWSSQYFEPVDGLPYIGHMPGQPGGILVATGFGGNGMVYSSVAAQLLKDIVLEKESNYFHLFNPNRVKPVAGFQNFVKENADVLKQFLGKLGSKEELDGLADIAPGEGKLVKYEGHSIALYKDEEGNLHALNPVCTHMKCNVAWNNAERSWDCPCHGARYDIDGRVLTGPADMDLQKIELPVLIKE
jgi:glycine/D-amino acid oxidase-like deaminating enzyme/nitrite reductase/ring-hydroxylating ferredoxin subunit